MRFLIGLSVFMSLVSVFGDSAVVLKEDFSGKINLSDPHPVDTRIYSDSSLAVIEEGAMTMTSKKGKTEKAYVTAEIANRYFHFSFDVKALKEFDEGYGRSVYFNTPSGAVWLIEFKKAGGTYFYTTNSMSKNHWAVRGEGRIPMGAWVRVSVANTAKMTSVVIADRETGRRICGFKASHDSGGVGNIIFQTVGANMGMRIDNVELRCDRKNLRQMSTLPGIERLVDPWKPSSEIENFKRIIAMRGDKALSPIECWFDDMNARDDAAAEVPTLRRSGSFFWSVGENDLCFGNTSAAYRIKGNSIWSIYDLRSRMECVSKGRSDIPIWKVTLKSQDGKTKAEITPTASPKSEVKTIDGELVLVMKWSALKGNGISGTIDVEVTATLSDGDSVASWRIKVGNNLGDGGLWRVYFPVVGNLGYPGESDVCGSRLVNPHPGLGDLTRASKGPLSHKYLGHLVPKEYPGGGVQLVSISCGTKTSLYIATEDGEGYYKSWAGDLSGAYEMSAYPPNMTVPGADYAQSYDTKLGPIKGDWFDCAKRYRKWALKQKWCAAGPLVSRKIPEKFKNIDIMLRTGLWNDARGGSKWNRKKQVWELTERGRQWRDACGTIKYPKRSSMLGCSPVEQVERQFKRYSSPDSTIVVHTYMWHQNLFDDMYPDFLPAIKGFKELTAKWQKQGMIVMPYTNGWMLDTRVPWFKQAEPYLARGIDGSIDKGRMRSNTSPITHPCVYTKFWRDKIAGLAKFITNDLGCDGLYIDQTAGVRPLLCFDKSHGHPLGGGKWFGDAQRSIFKAVRKAAGKPIYLSSEWFCEYYLDQVDDFLLIWGAHGIQSAPLIPAIYGGYTAYDGSRIESQDDRDTVKVVFGRTLLWGSRFGHIICLQDEIKNIQGYLKNLLKLRREIRDYVQFGEMLRPPNLLSPAPTMILNKWEGAHGVKKVLAPAFERSLWQAPHGSLGLVVVNYSAKPQTALLSTEFLPKGTKRLTLLTGDGKPESVAVTVGTPLEITIPAERGIALTSE